MDLIDTGVFFFALLGLLAMVGTVVALAALVTHRLAPGFGPAAALVTAGRSLGLPLATVVAVTTTLGSLFLSQVAGFVPCELCWYQRIFAWPLSVILTVAALRRDRTVWTYALPLCTIGAAVSIWHVLIERVPALARATACDATASCTVRWVWEFGFVSIPLLALTSFVAIATGTWMARPSPGTDDSDGTCDGTGPVAVDPDAQDEYDRDLELRDTLTRASSSPTVHRDRRAQDPPRD